MTRVLYLDLVGGAAGDMLLAALLDLGAGATVDGVREIVSRLGLSEVTVDEVEVRPAGLRARRVDVRVGGHLGDHDHDHDHDHHHHHHGEEAAHPHRPWPVVRRMIEDAELSSGTKERALDAFRRLAEAEAEAHGVDVEGVTFHEVGADDAITDIVGVAAAIEAIGADEIVVSPVPLGRGLTHGAHGPIPLPGPATLSLLLGAETAETTLEGETVTPTGAALLASLADRWGPMPAMTIEKIGVGAGHKSWPDRPNVVRAMLGTKAAQTPVSREDAVVEANIDDMSPEHFAALERALLEAGALDVWSTTAQMKKGRRGATVHALVRKSTRDGIVQTFLDHSTTLGVRVLDVERHRATRRIEPVTTEYGIVRVKIAPRRGAPLIAPEHDDVDHLAKKHAVPVRVVYEATLRAAWAAETEDP